MSKEGTKGKWRDSTAVLRATCGTHDNGCLSYCFWRNNVAIVFEIVLSLLIDVCTLTEQVLWALLHCESVYTMTGVFETSVT